MHQQIWSCFAFVSFSMFLVASSANAVVRVEIGSSIPDPDGKVVVNITLDSSNESVGGTQNDILFDSRIVDLGSESSCWINPEIGDRSNNCEADPAEIASPCKTLVRSLADCGFTPRPPGCERSGPGIKRLRAIVAAIATPNNIPIPNGSRLYSCTFEVVDDSRLPSALRNSNLIVSDPSGVRLPAAEADGSIVECLSDGDCQDSYCVDSVCCESRVCQEGTLCNIAGHYGECSEPQALGAGCDRNSDCKSMFCNVLGETFTPDHYPVCSLQMTPTASPTSSPSGNSDLPSTPTLSQTPATTATARPPTRTPLPMVRIDVRDAQPADDGSVTIDVILQSRSYVDVTEVRNDIVFNNQILYLPTVTSCEINPSISDIAPICHNESAGHRATCKSLIGSLTPCSESSELVGCPSNSPHLSYFRATIANTGSQSAIPNGTLLYRCRFILLDPGRLPTDLLNLNATAIGRGAWDLRTTGFSGKIVSCLQDADCPTGRCVDDVCCSVDSCHEGAFCNISGHLGQCHVTLPNGAPCDRNSDCQSKQCNFIETAPASRMRGHCILPPTPLPTRTFTSTSTRIRPKFTREATFTPTPTPVVRIRMEVTAPDADGTVILNVTLANNAGKFTAVQGDLLFDTEILDLGTSASCQIDATISDATAKCTEANSGSALCKTLVGELFTCDAGASISGCYQVAPHFARYRAMVASRDGNTDNGIPDGSLLYSCRFKVVHPDVLPTSIQFRNGIALGPFESRLPIPPTYSLVAECFDGADCSTGNCIDDTCCETPSCPNGLFCNVRQSKGVCAQPLKNGDTCFDFRDCESRHCVHEREGYVCRNRPTPTSPPTPSSPVTATVRPSKTHTPGREHPSRPPSPTPRWTSVLTTVRTQTSTPPPQVGGTASADDESMGNNSTGLTTSNDGCAMTASSSTGDPSWVLLVGTFLLSWGVRVQMKDSAR